MEVPPQGTALSPPPSRSGPLSGAGMGASSPGPTSQHTVPVVGSEAAQVGVSLSSLQCLLTWSQLVGCSCPQVPPWPRPGSPAGPTAPPPPPRSRRNTISLPKTEPNLTEKEFLSLCPLPVGGRVLLSSGSPLPCRARRGLLSGSDSSLLFTDLPGSQHRIKPLTMIRSDLPRAPELSTCRPQHCVSSGLTGAPCDAAAAILILERKVFPLVAL